MQFDVLTLFPGMFNPVLNESIIGRAIDSGNIKLRVVDIRDFSSDKHKKTDGYPYGGGKGMVMTPQPLYDAWKSVAGGVSARTVYMSPQGKTFTQRKALELAKEQRLIIICGHYEGIDERVIELIADEEISMGDYVLTGGELPAMTLIDSVARLVPGVLMSDESYKFDSHFDGLLEYPQYTRPPEFMGKCVPEILLTGNHAAIEKWRREQSFYRTKIKRPDLVAAPVRRLDLAGALNARDLGGYRTTDGMVTRWKTFLRTDILTDLSRSDIKTLRLMGLSTLIDLRSKTESSREPEPFKEEDSVSSHNIQILSEDLINATIRGGPFKELYIKFAELGKKKIVRVFHVMAGAKGLCLFHCHAGKDRTGIIAALLLSLVKVRRSDVIADYEVSATYFRPKVFDIIDPETGKPLSEHIRSDAGTIEYFLDYIDNKYGGAERYLLDAGLSCDDVLDIKNKFLVPDPISLGRV